MHRHSTPRGNLLGGPCRPDNISVWNDGGLLFHGALVPNAPDCSKCQLHHSPCYCDDMETPNQRLKLARIRAGYESASDAARALGLPLATYIQHENGYRGFPVKRAPTYARKFKVSEEWLLYGKGQSAPPSSEPSELELAAMLSDAMMEIPVGTKLGEWPRLVAGLLHIQLTRFRDDRDASGNLSPSKTSGLQPLSLPSTTPADPE